MDKKRVYPYLRLTLDTFVSHCELIRLAFKECGALAIYDKQIEAYPNIVWGDGSVELGEWDNFPPGLVANRLRFELKEGGTILGIKFEEGCEHPLVDMMEDTRHLFGQLAEYWYRIGLDSKMKAISGMKASIG